MASVAPTALDATWSAIRSFISEKWDAEVVPTMSEYIKVPNQSPSFDPDFATNGLQEQAMAVLVDWLEKQEVHGMKYELLEEKGRTPFLLIEIDGTQPTEKTLLMYGHMDKQPPLRPWDEGLDPYKPVLRDGKLYGRAGADDGYAICASVLSVMALQKQSIPHARVVIMIEGDEESGSTELPEWVRRVRDRIGDVDLLITLDSGGLSYDRLWLTGSLRGVVVLTIEATASYEGMHSGLAGGVIPDTTRVLRHALSQVEDSATGDILLPELQTVIPAWVTEGLKAVDELGWDHVKATFPFRDGVAPECTTSVLETVLRNLWKPSLTVVGADGLPSVHDGGNVLRALTRFRLSARIPPGVKPEVASAALVEALESAPLHGVKVQAKVLGSASGWSCPQQAPWLTASLNEASKMEWGKPMAVGGIGGTIPFIGMLADMFPEAEQVITGVLGPQSNAHGPNEFLHVEYGKGINLCMARVVADHFKNCPKKK